MTRLGRLAAAASCASLLLTLSLIVEAQEAQEAQEGVIPPPPPQKAGAPAPESGLTWDGNFEAGLGSALQTPDHLSGFGRVRTGVTYADHRDLGAPMFYSLGAYYELSDLSLATFGVQGEIMSLVSGMWFQAGAGIDAQPRPVLLGAVGWSVLGVETQARWDETRGDYFAIYAKLRLPLSVMVYGAR